jgi:hypothetical protein
MSYGLPQVLMMAMLSMQYYALQGQARPHHMAMQCARLPLHAATAPTPQL